VDPRELSADAATFGDADDPTESTPLATDPTAGNLTGETFNRFEMGTVQPWGK